MRKVSEIGWHDALAGHLRRYSLEKKLNAYFLTVTVLFVVTTEGKYRSLFRNSVYTGKKNKIKKSGHGTDGISENRSE